LSMIPKDLSLADFLTRRFGEGLIALKN
jgi:hypothetical protein